MMNPFESLISDTDIDQLSRQECLIFDESRRKILKAMHSIDVQACPGSGKTTLIAAKLILLAQKWPLKHQGICVLSHTNVAKDEIISRLKVSNIREARSLLSYPHFIGTIQEFVNRFLALPYLRQNVQFNRFLEGLEGYREVLFYGVGLESICKSLYYKCGKASYEEIKSFLGSLFWLNAAKDIGFYGQYGNLLIYKNDLTKKVYPQLLALKESLISKGCFQYRDMYAYADQLLNESVRINDSLRIRFPLVLLDEMQDAQEFQDDLLRKVFPLYDEAVVIQRFGDPDQAIFNGINGEEPNRSYNGKSKDCMDFVIEQSHRFDDSIASVIKGLSFNEVPLASELSRPRLEERKSCYSSGDQFEHTIFIFDEGAETRVIPEFAKHVSAQFATEYKKSEKFSVKVVGAVGNEIDKEKQLKIGHYWPGFKKNKAKSSFKESTLQEAVGHCRTMTDVNWSERYKLLHNCFLKILRMADKKDADGNYFSAASMKDYLRERGEWNNFRRLIFCLINPRINLNDEMWAKAVAVIQKVLELDDLSGELKDYLAYLDDAQALVPGEAIEEHGELRPVDANTIYHRDGFRIELSTIHGVKGQTHDATLILETKNYRCDLEVMLRYLTGELPDQDNQNVCLKENPSNSCKPNQKFMRQLYVGMSRPKHLLCLAMRKQALNAGEVFAANVSKLESLGWHFHEIDGAE